MLDYVVEKGADGEWGCCGQSICLNMSVCPHPKLQLSPAVLQETLPIKPTDASLAPPSGKTEYSMRWLWVPPGGEREK